MKISLTQQRLSSQLLIHQGSGRVADFFKRWLLYTKEFDDDANNPEWEVPYEITELDDIRSGQVSTVLPYHSRQPGNEVDLPPRYAKSVVRHFS